MKTCLILFLTLNTREMVNMHYQINVKKKTRVTQLIQKFIDKLLYQVAWGKYLFIFQTHTFGILQMIFHLLKKVRRVQEIDNILVLQFLIHTLINSKKKSFCAFVDLKQAFGKVWRDGLWYKLLKCGINGTCFTYMKDTYKGIKSKICINGFFIKYFLL